MSFRLTDSRGDLAFGHPGIRAPPPSQKYFREKRRDGYCFYW